MAPEGWRNETNTIQLDMYAVGVVAYLVASLQYPYSLPKDISDFDAIRRMHLFDHPKSLQSHRPGLPLPFCQWVAETTRKATPGPFLNLVGGNREVSKSAGEWPIHLPIRRRPNR